MNRDPGENGYDKAEEWINGALAEYVKAEPRAGFDRRVLARLHAAQEQSRRNGWWRGVFAIGAAAMLLLTLLWLGYQNARQVSEAQITKAAPKATEPDVEPKEDESASERIGPSKRDQRELAKATIKNGFSRTLPPREAQFPAALPLNDQERMLARYVEDFPERAALVARAQTDLHKLNELEMNKSPAAKETNHSDPQE